LLWVLQKVALALADRAGARLAVVLGAPVSRSTLILLIMRLPELVQGMAPRVLGADDFALRKGKRYGMILLDVQSHRAVDVLADRATRPSRHCCEHAPASRSSAGSAPVRTLRRPARPRPMHCRS
jgi:hypothetical protein